MATQNLGRVGYAWKGTYKQATTYRKYDNVLYNGSSYIYINDTPSSGKVPTNDTYWNCIAHGGTGGGTSDYNELENKPQINGVTLTGDKTADDLGLGLKAEQSGENLTLS